MDSYSTSVDNTFFYPLRHITIEKTGEVKQDLKRIILENILPQTVGVRYDV